MNFTKSNLDFQRIFLIVIISAIVVMNTLVTIRFYIDNIVLKVAVLHLLEMHGTYLVHLVT